MEKNSDLIFKVMNTMYPNIYDYFDEDSKVEETKVYDEVDGELLFFFMWDDNSFYISYDFIDNMFSVTGFSFLDLDVIQEDLESFYELIKVFAKRHYGWNVNDVYFYY